MHAQLRAQALDSLVHAVEEQAVGGQRTVIVAYGIGELEPPVAGDREIEHRINAFSG